MAVMNSEIIIRQGEETDQDWLYQMFRTTLHNYIDDAWGWDELLQREGFLTSLPAKQFQVLEVDKVKTGSFHITEHPDHLVLDMILVEPPKQRNGYGSLLMESVKDLSVKTLKPIHLSVLKSNPAIEFHVLEGFSTLEEDEHSLKMIWQNVRRSSSSANTDG